MTSALQRETSSPSPTPVDDVADAKRRFRPATTIATIVILLVAVQIIAFMVTSDKFEWGVVAQYLFYPTVLVGLGVTLLLTVVCMVLGSILGAVVAVGQLSNTVVLKRASQAYVAVFRGVPPLVQLIFWFNLAYLLPNLSLGVPFGPSLFSVNTNDVLTPLTAAIIGLTLHEAAYMSEIIRAGIISVDRGQVEAAKAMGFTSGQTFRKIVLPQAMRVIIPPTGSQVIGLLKGTSLVSVIGMTDLLLSVQLIYNSNYKVVPLLIVAVIWYLVVVSILTFIQKRVEEKFGQGLAPPSRKVKAVRMATIAAEGNR